MSDDRLDELGPVGDEADGGGHEAGAEQDLGQGRRFHNLVFKL